MSAYQNNAVLQKLIAQKLLSLAAKEVNLQEASILDVGCGTGFVAQTLQIQNAGFANVMQYDASQSHLNIAKNFGNVKLVNFNTQAFPTYKCNIIFASMCLQWASDINKTLQNIKKSAGGSCKIFASVPLYGSLAEVYNILGIAGMQFPQIPKEAKVLCIKEYVENAYIALKGIHLEGLRLGGSAKISKKQVAMLKQSTAKWKIAFFLA